MKQYFRIAKNGFNEPYVYFVVVTENKDNTFTIRNKDTFNPLFENIDLYRKNQLLESWIEYDKNGIVQEN